MLGLCRWHMMAAAGALIGIAGLSCVLAGVAQPPGDTSSLVAFTPDGKLKKPEGYRKWVYVGTPITPNELNGGEAPFPDFHAVYVDPESYAHYEKTGEFRDGTVMIKELVGIGAKEATSGKGYFMGDFIGLEASVKDSKRFKDEPGNWAFFSFGHKYPLKAEAPKQNAAACNACHQTSAVKDYVFSQFYPVLRGGTACEVKTVGSRGGRNCLGRPAPSSPQTQEALPWIPTSPPC